MNRFCGKQQPYGSYAARSRVLTEGAVRGGINHDQSHWNLIVVLHPLEGWPHSYYTSP